MVRCQQNAHATTADEDANDLEDLVADLQDEERDDDDADNGPEVQKLGGQEVGVSVGEDGKVVSLDIEEGHDQVLPAVLPGHTRPGAGTILDEEDESVDNEEKDVVEETLEGGDAGPGLGEKGTEGVGGGDAQSQSLSDGDDDPEVASRKVAIPVDRLGFEDVDALSDSSVFAGGGSGGVGDGSGGGLEALVGLVGVFSGHCVGSMSSNWVYVVGIVSPWVTASR